MTRAKLLSGRDQPLSHTEYIDWVALARIENAELKEAQKSRRNRK